MILLLVWNTFCGTFYSNVHAENAGSVVLIVVICMSLYILFTALCFASGMLIARTPWLQRWFKVTRSGAPNSLPSAARPARPQTPPEAACPPARSRGRRLAPSPASPLFSHARRTRADVVAMMYIGATKTLALGMPLISVLYTDSDSIALLALPLIIFHASQTFQGNFLIKPFKK